MTTNSSVIFETVLRLVRTHVDRKARMKGDEGIVYYLRYGKKDFRRKFITFKKAKQIYNDLYGD